MKRYHRVLMGWVILSAVTATAAAGLMNLRLEADAADAIIAEQAESIAALEESNKLLRQEVDRLTQERDEARRVQTSRSADRPRLTLAEMRALAGTVYREARGESPFGKMLVAKVALNRLRWNPGMTMHQILNNRGTAFAVGNTYESADMAAVMEALADTEYDHLAGFHNPDDATDPEAHKKKILFREGGHVFW